MKKFPANVMVAFCDRLSNALKSEKAVLQVSMGKNGLILNSTSLGFFQRS